LKKQTGIRIQHSVRNRIVPDRRGGAGSLKGSPPLTPQRIAEGDFGSAAMNPRLFEMADRNSGLGDREAQGVSLGSGVNLARLVTAMAA
jgi:hypothetical protein